MRPPGIAPNTKTISGQCYPGQTIAEGCNKLEFGGVFNGQDYEGRTPPKAPEFAGRLGASFERAVTASGITLKWNGDLSYTSEYNFTDALRPDAVQDAFTKIDTSIALVAPDGRWTVSLIGRNLTNETGRDGRQRHPVQRGHGHGHDNWRSGRHVGLRRQPPRSLSGVRLAVLIRRTGRRDPPPSPLFTL